MWTTTTSVWPWTASSWCGGQTAGSFSMMWRQNLEVHSSYFIICLFLVPTFRTKFTILVPYFVLFWTSCWIKFGGTGDELIPVDVSTVSAFTHPMFPYFFLSYIYLGYFVCVCVCVSQFVSERSAILLVLLIKLTKERRRRVWRGRD